MPAYRSGVRTARAASGSGARTSTAVPSQVAPSSDSSGPYAISSSGVWRHGKVGGLPGAEAEHQVAITSGPAAGEVLMVRPEKFAPPAQQHVPVHTGLVAGLVEGERAGGGGIEPADDVHAAGGRVAVAGEGRATGDHLRLARVHVGRVLF